MRNESRKVDYFSLERPGNLQCLSEAEPSLAGVRKELHRRWAKYSEFHSLHVCLTHPHVSSLLTQPPPAHNCVHNQHVTISPCCTIPYFCTVQRALKICCIRANLDCTRLQWRTEGGSISPLPEIPKVLQNRATLNPIVKTVKNC